MLFNTTSRSESRSGSESTEEKEETDVSIHPSESRSTPRVLSRRFSHPPTKKRQLKSAQGRGLGIGETFNDLMHDSEQYNMYNQARNFSALNVLTTWSKKDGPQEYVMKEKRRNKTNKTGLLEDSDLILYGKNKQSEKEKTERLPSEPMFNQDYNLKKKRTKRIRNE